MPEICKITYMDVTPLADPALFADAMSRVPESRKQKIASFRYAESQRLSLGVGLLLVLALEEQGIDGRRVRITEGEWGKPVLTDFPGIHFSLSHSGQYAAVLIADSPCGVDIEEIREIRENLVQRCMHPEELASGMDFFEAWTKKECIVKLDGGGIPPHPYTLNTLDAKYKGFFFTYEVRNSSGESYALTALCNNGIKPEIHN